MDLGAAWDAGMTFDAFVSASEPEHRGLWEGIYRTARVPAWAQAALPVSRRLLVIAEDWCGDAVNIVPVLAKWVDSQPALSLRIVRRDENPELMNRYLTNGSRSIPMVIVLDSANREVGHWGPRPRELQAWVLANRNTMPKDERYREVRRWYARDHGETSIREVLEAGGLAKAA